MADMDALLAEEPAPQGVDMDALLAAPDEVTPAAPVAQRAPDPSMTRFLRGAAVPVVTAGQMMARPLSYAGGRINQLIGGNAVSDLLQGSPDELDYQASAMRKARAAGAPDGTDWASMAGETAATLPFGVAKVAGVWPWVERALQGAATGGALMGGTEKPGTGQPMAAAAGAALFPPALKGVAQLIGPRISQAAQVLKSLGVDDMTLGQLSGGAVARAEQALTSVPVMGDMIRNRLLDSFKSFNKAVGNYVLKPVSEALPKDVEAGNDSIEHVQRVLGGKYDDILSRGSIDPGVIVQNLNPIMAQAKSMLRPQDAEEFQRIMQNEVANVVKPGQMLTGEAYKKIDSNLRKWAGSYYKKDDQWSSMVGDAVSGVKNFLRSEFDTQNPSLAGELAPVDSAWARFKRYQSAGAAITSGKNAGVFTPEQLLSATRRLDTTKDKSNFASGNALMQDLAKSAMEVMGNRVPDSGTPLRSAWGLMLPAAGAEILGEHMPMTAPFTLPTVMGAGAALGAGSMLYTPTGTRMVNRLLSSRPDLAFKLADRLRQAAPAFAPVGAQIGAQSANPLLNGGP